MLKTRFALAAVALYSGIFVEQSIAGPLTSAEVTKIINRVSVIEPAKAIVPLSCAMSSKMIAVYRRPPDPARSCFFRITP